MTYQEFKRRRAEGQFQIFVNSTCIIVPEEYDNDSTPTFEMFSLVTGKSPYFKTIDEVVKYYNELNANDKQKHHSIIKGKVFLFFYQHSIARVAHKLSHGYECCKGEVLSTDEYHIYSKSTKKWNWEAGFPLN